METALGCGYSINDESVLTDFYSPPSSIADEEEELFYPEEEEEEEEELKPLPLKLMSIETTTPPTTPHYSRHLLDPLNSTIMDFQNMKIISDLSSNNSLLPTTPTNLLTPTSMDRYLIEHHRISDSIYKSSQNVHQSISVQHTEISNGSERSRLYSYMNPIDDSMMKSSSSLNNSLFPRQVQSVFPYQNNQLNHSSIQDSWFLSEMSTILRQNNNNNHNHISLSTTAQQILNGNNRPLRSEKIDIEVIKHLIREANWKRQCGMKKEICVFCRNNGENELIYSSHSLKDPIGNVTCPILRAYQCPICGATGSQAHTIKYCQATGDDTNRHLPTPYEKMLHIQTFGFDDTIPSYLGQFSSPSSLYSNGWSDSYL
jgi:hypothetical protein